MEWVMMFSQQGPFPDAQDSNSNNNSNNLQIIDSMKIFLTLLLAALLATSQAQAQPQETVNDPNAPSNGTESYFVSPHALGHTPEVTQALDKMEGQVIVARTTTYKVSGLSYLIQNMKVKMAYNPSKQVVTIPKADLMQITGGRIEFTYEFNYTKIENGNNLTGHAYGSVLSDGLNYSKIFTFCNGFVCFCLPDSEGMVSVKINENQMGLKRMEPYNDTDLVNLQDMLNNATKDIDPLNMKDQIVGTFNQLFPYALNESLNHETFGETVNYTWHSSSHGEMNLNILHHNYGFGIDPIKGVKFVFVTLIDGWGQPICEDYTVPLKPASFQIYGGTQAYHNICLYESVIFYLQSNGWLDATLNINWDSNAFQFYAGDLFDLINSLYLDFSPRSILDGSCVAQKSGLEFHSDREYDSNTYVLLTTYICSLKGTSKSGTTTQVLKFTAHTRLHIQAGVTSRTLTFKIKDASLDDISFQAVGKYVVSDLNLAAYRATSVLKTLENTFTFGTNYPTVTMEYPKVMVDRNWVFYYDNSHFEGTPQAE